MSAKTNQTFSPSRVKWIFIKEIKSFFGANYPVVSLFLVLVMCALVSVILPSTPGTTYEDVSRALFWVYYILTIAFGILISIGSFASERRQGTLELLYTLPLTDLELVIAKFLPGAIFLGAISLMITLVYVVGIAEAPWYMALSGFFGLFLVGLYATSITVFASSLTGSYLLSLVVAVVIALVIDVGGYLGGMLPSPGKELAVFFHGLSQFGPFARGIIPLKGTVFFLSLSGLFLFLSVKVLESRRWRLQSGGN